LWQKIDETGRICHSWQKPSESMITAMTIAAILALAFLFLPALGLYLAVMIRNDGYGLPLQHHEPPRSHPRDRWRG